ncbi:vasopressin V1b receptor-like, partial [Thrips palmi]|uniref:Vasopressin V1b receptor-like n=1 Tax=Thrips palmi TaxID=161013 RepID=A0A6P8YG37_THRPL
MFYFILHLSVADMVTAFFSVLPQLVWKVTFRFQGGNVLCKVVKFGQPLGVYLSSYVLTATALDRYRAICHPLTYCSWSSRRAKMMVYVAWGVAVCFSAPQAFIFSLRQLGPDESDCWADFHPDWGVRSYVTWYACSVFVVPLLVLSFTYSRITCEIWRCASSRTALPAVPAAPARHGQQGKADTPCQQAHAYAYRFTTRRQGVRARPGRTTGSFVAVRVRSATTRTNPLISRAKINTVKQSVLVIMLYIVCSGPFICAQLWSAWTSPAEDDYLSESSTLYTILTLLFSLNSCVNPWIYLAFNKDLTSTLRMLVSCKGPVAASSMQSSCSSPPNGAVPQLAALGQEPGMQEP